MSLLKASHDPYLLFMSYDPYGSEGSGAHKSDHEDKYSPYASDPKLADLFFGYQSEFASSTSSCSNDQDESTTDPFVRLVAKLPVAV